MEPAAMESAPAHAVPARPLPDGPGLTFLFTDVEGSTPLWERHEALMRAVSARHDALLDSIITKHGGRRVRERGEGDSLFAVFPEPSAAVAAALAMARAVLAEPWPAETPIRLRMGLHTGAAQLRAGDYYGPVVNRCARIRGLGHGGQVLLSSTTADLVRAALPDGTSVRSLGAHSLKGLSEAAEVFQLCHPALQGAFPPLLSPQAPRHNLPATLSSLVGREAEQGEVLALLGEARLVTLVGSGGVGKTRLALAVATELVDRYADGVWLAELAALGGPGLVPGAVAAALGVREEPGRPLAQTLADHLREKRALLVLDNCEHLLEGCAALASALLRACPGLRVLATSHEGLGVAGERRWRVPSLSVPDPRYPPPPELAESYEAVRLFVARARERRADFALGEGNARAVARICARLDGIPLAIELAAARVGSLSVEGIEARLDDRFRLLTGGGRDQATRQRTLRAALDWSWDLLDGPERALLGRLSVFAGGWTLAAAEAVCAGDGVEAWDILDLLDGLVNKSLAHVQEAGGELRYGLLETVRQYGQERLAAAGGAAARDRHLGWCVALAEEAEPQLRGPKEEAWQARLEAEHDNLRAALGWAREAGASELGLRLAGALSRFWSTGNHHTEGRDWLAAALAAAGPEADPAHRAAALVTAGTLAWPQGDLDVAVALLSESLALYRGLGHAPGIADVLRNLAVVAMLQADYAQAAAWNEEALALNRGLGRLRDMAIILMHMGNLAAVQGASVPARERYQEGLALARGAGNRPVITKLLFNLGWLSKTHREAGAAALLRESLALARELGDTRTQAAALHLLGALAREQREYREASTLLEEGVGLSRALGDRQRLADGLAELGQVAAEEHADARALVYLAEAMALYRAMDDRRNLAALLERLAGLAGARGRGIRAGRLWGAAAALRAEIGAPRSPSEQDSHERAAATVRAACGKAAFAAAWAAGEALPLDEALEEALAP